MMNQKKKVFVTGCYDMLHSGHVAFLTEAASYGELYVGIGSDATINELKGRFPVNTQDERKYMIDALTCVHQCMVNTGPGILDFLHELDAIEPDIFLVNEDGNTPEKESLCVKKNIEYHVLKRIPHKSLPRRSTTDLRTECNIPYRIDLAGGWIDQPYVSKFCSGPVITISIEPTIEFNELSGMASSTRRKAIELWHSDIPAESPEKLARILFSYENPPGTEQVSGSQDSIGIVYPGLNRLNYAEGVYWPNEITINHDASLLEWIENHISLINLGPRHRGYHVLNNTHIDAKGAKTLSDAAANCWDSILKRDVNGFGRYLTASFEAQVAMFPNMIAPEIHDIINSYRKKALGWKLSGAGGGGYLILVSEKPLENAIKIKIRRPGL